MQSNLPIYAELFAADEEWLSRQQGMSNFHRGCSELVGQMNEWIKHYTADICGRSVDEGTAQHAGYLRRVWGCWRHNWKKAAGDGIADGHDTAAKIRGQVPAADKDKAGSDLIHDVILVEAVLQGNDSAIIYFDRFHNDLVNRLAARSDPSLNSDRSWWRDTMSRMIGTSVKPGPLKGFIGDGDLLGYMYPVIQRDLVRVGVKLNRERDRLRDYGKRALGTDSNSPIDDAMTRDCHSLFRNACREALDDSSASDRAAAILVVVNGLKRTEAATVLTKHKGTITRAMDRIYGRLKDIVCQPNGDFSAVFRDCGEHLFGGRDRAIRLLREVIEEDYVEEARS